MKGNVKNGDRKKKEKMENFAEFVRKNREKQKKENEKEKQKFSIKIIDFEKDIIREKANNINLTEKKKNHTITKRSFSTNSEKRKKENNPFVNSYSLLYKNKKESRSMHNLVLMSASRKTMCYWVLPTSLPLLSMCRSHPSPLEK